MNTKTAQVQESVANLKGWLTDGATVYSIIRSVSRSGMSRRIDFLIFKDGRTYALTSNVAKVLGLRFTTEDWSRQNGALVHGCGMDMAFHCVDSLARVLGLKLNSQIL